MLFGVVVFPFDADGAVVPDSIQLDHDFFDAVGVALRAGGDKVPAVEPMAHRAMAAQKPGPRVLANHLNSLDVSAVNALAELADKLHDRDALPFHVGTIQVKA